MRKHILIGSELRAHRLARQMTQLELAEAVGCRREYINKLENDPDEQPGDKLMVIIADVLRYPIEAFTKAKESESAA